ncbi:ABC transporter permease subunit [Acetobacterium bakii]|uniref:ABC transporter n=1 Tax=Acetobacterium bakii TaxID=52689 RepID=A0A0L6U3T4_9FIRM|nr:ABC transporter permease subunit [Acetobacterium bakii]KNZ43178.1 hypothetical protein AKG39_03275 [Acetobacterium bakii]
MNIFFKELKANYKSLLIWSCAQVFIIFAGMMKYKGFADSGVDINSLFAGFPKELLVVFGMGSTDISQVAGFYSVFFLYFMLLAAVHAVMFGAVVVSKEERDHSADFLFSRPVKRHEVITPKLLAGVVNILFFNLVTFGASVFFIGLYNNGDGLVDKVAITMVALFVLQLFFLALGAMLGASLKTTKIATSAAAGIILGTFFLSVAVDLNANFDILKYLTPFKYFNAKMLVIDGTLSLNSVGILLVVTFILTTLCYLIFNKRDLST